MSSKLEEGKLYVTTIEDTSFDSLLALALDSGRGTVLALPTVSPVEMSRALKKFEDIAGFAFPDNIVITYYAERAVDLHVISSCFAWYDYGVAIDLGVGYDDGIWDDIGDSFVSTFRLVIYHPVNGHGQGKRWHQERQYERNYTGYSRLRELGIPIWFMDTLAQDTVMDLKQALCHRCPYCGYHTAGWDLCFHCKRSVDDGSPYTLTELHNIKTALSAMGEEGGGELTDSIIDILDKLVRDSQEADLHALAAAFKNMHVVASAPIFDSRADGIQYAVDEIVSGTEGEQSL